MNIPPKPPDPPDRPAVVDCSPPIFTQESQQESNRKHKLPFDPPNSTTGLDKRTRGLNDIDTSVSLQTLFTHPSFTQSRTYSEEDSGPFIVHVSRTQEDPANGSNIRPIKFGHLMHTYNVKGIVKDGIKAMGRRKISVEFKCSNDANNFVKSTVLSNNNYSAVIPTFHVTRMGLVRGVPVDWSLDEFIESLEIPDGCGIVLKARRLNRKTNINGSINWVPTQTVVLTFSGQKLPNRVYSFHTSMLVETYQLPTIQCHNCCRFGHIKAQCRSSPRCFRCAQNHSGDSCPVTEEKASCLLCSGNHFATNRICLEHDRQKRIKQLMSQNNISYMEASTLTPKTRRPYSDVAKEVRSSLFASLTPSQSSSKSPSLPRQSISYRKSIPTNPRPRTALPMGYDRQAHQAIIAGVPSTLPNGYALQSSSQPEPSTTDNDQLIETCLSMLTVILSKFNDSLPPNVASRLSCLFNTLPKSVLSPDYNADEDRHSNSAMEL